MSINYQTLDIFLNGLCGSLAGLLAALLVWRLTLTMLSFSGEKDTIGQNGQYRTWRRKQVVLFIFLFGLLLASFLSLSVHMFLDYIWTPRMMIEWVMEIK